MKSTVDKAGRDEIGNFLMSRVKKFDDSDEYKVNRDRDYDSDDGSDDEDANFKWEDVDGFDEEKEYNDRIFVDLLLCKDDDVLLCSSRG